MDMAEYLFELGESALDAAQDAVDASGHITLFGAGHAGWNLVKTCRAYNNFRLLYVEHRDEPVTLRIRPTRPHHDEDV